MPALAFQRVDAVLGVMQQLLGLAVCLLQEQVLFAEQQWLRDTEAPPLVQLSADESTLNPNAPSYVPSPARPSHATKETLPATANKKASQQEADEYEETKQETALTKPATKATSQTTRASTKKPTKAKAAPTSSNEMALWVNLLSNAPETLIQKYPEMLALFRQQHFLGTCDGVLHGLKATNLNGKEIIFKGRNLERKRFVVQLFDLSPTPRTILVKDENTRRLKPEPVSCAYSKFKDSLNEHQWNELTLGNLCFKNEALVSLFISDQLPYDLEMTAKTQEPYDDIWEDSMRELSEHGIGVTESECQIIISFLYSLAFSRKVHILRRFVIPLNWKVRKWKGNLNLFLPLPPNF